MTFPTGWGCKCPLVIQANKVDSNQSDFPVLLTEDTLPSEMFDADGSYPALDGGGDIRFSSDSSGSTQLACEVVTFTTDNDPANGVAEIWVKVPSASSSTNTTIYVWYNKAGESQPASNDTYGSENVWDSNFKMVQHMNEDPSGTVPQMIDSTSNDNDGTSNGSMTSGDLVAAKIGKALDFDGSDDYVDCGDILGTEGSAITVEFWMKGGTSQNEYYGVVGKASDFTDDSSWLLNGKNSSNGIHFFVADGTSSSSSDYSVENVLDNNSHYIVGSWDKNGDGKARLYVDGDLSTTATDVLTNDIQNTTIPVQIGRYNDAERFFIGTIDEVHISDTARSVDWIKAEYNNQYDPSTFVIEGTPSCVTTAPPTTLAPTTLPPTTLAPTSLAPTTLAPTTLPPTTLPPTTLAPTTLAPTSLAPTSLAPTTLAPTTLPSTTLAPTTLAPTTIAPTTLSPTSLPPTTLAPTSLPPTTLAPTTLAPTSLPPTTLAPTTLPSTTLAPTTLVSTTLSPTTNLPEVICVKELRSVITKELFLKSVITKEIRSNGYLC